MGMMCSYEQEKHKQVAGNILEQLGSVKVGGFPLLAMIGAKKGTFVMLSGAGGLAFQFGKPTTGFKANKVLIKYDEGRDSYNVEFWYLGRKALDVSKVEEEFDLYAEQMVSYIARRLIAGCS